LPHFLSRNEKQFKIDAVALILEGFWLVVVMLCLQLICFLQVG